MSEATPSEPPPANPRAWRRVVEAEEAGRARMADEIHDNVIQPLAAALLGLDLAAASLDGEELAEASQAILRTRSIVRGSFRCLREILFELRPPSLDISGVASAASSLVDRFRGETGVEVRLKGRTPRLHPDAELALYRTLEAALGNVRRRRSVRSVEVSFARDVGRVLLTIRDDGEEAAGSPDPLEEDALSTAASRLDWVGGGLEVRMGRTGTAVAAYVPADAVLSRKGV